MSDTVSIQKGDLGMLVAGCMSWMPSDVTPETGKAFARLLTVFEEAHADEDAPGNEPAKVIVVTEAGGRERFYAADGWDAEEAVDVTSKGDVVATYPPGAWQRIHRDGATLPDVTLRKLSLAMQALQKIGATVLEADDKRRVPVGTARDALEQIADVDL